MFDPNLDVTFERTVDLPVEKIWEAWTNPKHVPHWFAPKPWMITDCSIDLRPGGKFQATMRSPEGQEFPVPGCYLEVVPNKRLVWTDSLAPGFRPTANPFFTAMIELERDGNKTKYKATAMHATEENRKKHEAMGFEQGWGVCLDQLVAYMKSL